MQEKPEQWANIHLHQTGFQHRQANVVDTGISGNDATGIGHYLLGDVEHCHDNIEGVGDEPDRHCRFEDPAHDEGRFKLRHVVVLGDHLNQLIAGNKGQDDACDGYGIIDSEADENKNADCFWQSAMAIIFIQVLPKALVPFLPM